MKNFLVFSIILLFGINELNSQEIRLKYKPPLIPASISVGKDGIDLSFEPSIATPIGTFSLEFTDQLFSFENGEKIQTRQKPEVRIVEKINNVIIYKNDLLVIIRNNRLKEDTYYRIRDGKQLSMEVNGKTNLEVKDGVLLINLNQASRYELQFIDNEQNIKNDKFYAIKEVHIKSSPTNSKVYVDNLLAGITPCKIQINTDRDFRIENEPNFRSSFKRIYFDDSISEYQFDLKSINPKLSITTKPNNALLTINGKKYANTPGTFYLPKNKYRIAIKKSGFRPYKETILLDRDLTIRPELNRNIIFAGGVLYDTESIVGFDVTLKGLRNFERLMITLGSFKVPSAAQQEFSSIENVWRGSFNFSQTNETILSEIGSFNLKLGYPLLNRSLFFNVGIGNYTLRYKNLKEYESTEEITLGDITLTPNERFTFEDDEGFTIDNESYEIAPIVGATLDLGLLLLSFDYHFSDTLVNNYFFGAQLNLGYFLKTK